VINFGLYFIPVYYDAPKKVRSGHSRKAIFDPPPKFSFWLEKGVRVRFSGLDVFVKVVEDIESYRLVYTSP
jgi:hypothetical protein